MFCETPNKGFPCGKCRACRLRKANEKMLVSVFAAAEYKKKGQFLTLTYDDKHKPNGLDHSHFQSFMKKLRELDGTPDVKYFMAGEYGGNATHREHFHVLFYNHRYDIDLVQKAWSEPRKRGRKKKGEVDPFIPFGFVYDGTLTPASMKYVSGYIDKKGYDPKSGKRPPYGRSSINIPDGLKPLEIFRAAKTGKIGYNGRIFSFPQKWRRRYQDIWRYFSDYRMYMKNHELVSENDFYDFRDEHGNYWRYSQEKEDALHNHLRPEQVKAIMDDKERKYNEKKAEREKKRLQRLLNRRIM